MDKRISIADLHIYLPDLPGRLTYLVTASALVELIPRFALEEAAWILGVSERHIRDRVKKGEIPVQADGDRRFITRNAINNYVRQTRPESPRSKAGKKSASKTAREQQRQASAEPKDFGHQE